MTGEPNPRSGELAGCCICLELASGARRRGLGPQGPVAAARSLRFGTEFGPSWTVSGSVVPLAQPLTLCSVPWTVDIY